MSRRCPKRNHLFLNWLKANRSRFLFEPQITKIKDHYIGGVFAGVTSAIQFSINKGGIVVPVCWSGECWDLIADFDVVEKRSDQGFYCYLCLPDARKYYPSREALWTEHAFEPLLESCNEKLATNQYLAIYDYGGCTDAKLQKDGNVIANPALEELLRGLIPLGGKKTAAEEEIDDTQKLVQMIPLFKSGRSRNRAENEAERA